MIYNITEIKEILQSRKLHCSKDRGQNFLTDERMAARIAEIAVPDGNLCVIEVGPGLGSLTWKLMNRAHHTCSVEFDRGFYEFLSEWLHNDSRVSLIHQDILKTDIEEIIQIFPDKQWVAVGNIPYNITAAIIMKFLNCPKISQMVFTMQKEVAERLCAVPRTKQYGALTVMVQSMASVNICLQIPAGSFFPAPKVLSTVVEITRKEQPDNREAFFSFIKKSFAQRRKTLPNNWKSFMTPDESRALLKKNGFAPDIRAEVLSADDFKNLYEQMRPK